MLKISALILGLSATVSVPASAQTECDPANIRYVGGAGIRMRQSASSTSTVIQNLTYNLEVCVLSEVGGWSSITIQSMTNKGGWVPKEFLFETATPREQIASELEEALSKRDATDAIKWSERLVESASTKFEKLHALLLFKRSLELADDKKRSSAVEAQILELRKSQDILTSSESDSYRGWFETKFGDSSTYYKGPTYGAVRPEDAELLLLHFESDPAQQWYTSSGIAYVLGSAVYPLAFEPTSSWPEGLRKRLRSEKLVASLVSASGAVYKHMPPDILNGVPLTDVALENCDSIGYQQVQAFANRKRLREKFASYVACLPEGGVAHGVRLVDFVQSISFLKEYFKENDDYIRSNVTRHREFFSGLTEELRRDTRILQLFMKTNVPVYPLLDAKLQQDPKIKAFGRRTTLCDEYFAINPADRASFVEFAKSGRMTLDCPGKLDPKVFNKKVAVAVVQALPGAYRSLPDTFKLDKDVVRAAVIDSAKLDPRSCPLDETLQSFDLSFKRRVVSIDRSCLGKLTVEDLEDPEIAPRILAGKIDTELLNALPMSYASDERILPLLDVIRDKESTVDQYLNPEVLLKLAASNGLEALAKINVYQLVDSEDASVEYEKVVWPYLNEIQDETFWKRLAEIAKSRSEPCENWIGIRKLVGYTSVWKEHSDTIKQITGCPFEGPKYGN